MLKIFLSIFFFSVFGCMKIFAYDNNFLIKTNKKLDIIIKNSNIKKKSKYNYIWELKINYYLRKLSFKKKNSSDKKNKN